MVASTDANKHASQAGEVEKKLWLVGVSLHLCTYLAEGLNKALLQQSAPSASLLNTKFQGSQNKTSAAIMSYTQLKDRASHCCMGERKFHHPITSYQVIGCPTFK